MRIAVYSGSFNPLHIGHQAIMDYLTREKEYDWVYLVVSPKNPIKTTISADTAEARYKAAIEAVSGAFNEKEWKFLLTGTIDSVDQSSNQSNEINQILIQIIQKQVQIIIQIFQLIKDQI